MVLSDIFGKPCCRQRVGRENSLSLGFGKKIFHEKNLIEEFYGEWEIGCFHSSWRIIVNNVIVCGGNDDVDSFDELNEIVAGIELGSISSIKMINDFDVCVTLKNATSVEFFCLSKSDEAFHIYGPDKMFIGLGSDGWTIGRSDLPSDNLASVDFSYLVQGK